MKKYDYQQNLRVFYKLVPNRSFGKLLKIFIFLKTFKSEFSYIEVKFTDKNAKPPET